MIQTRIDTITIHCSDSDLRKHDNPESIKAWHLKRGFNDIGYHYIITSDGRLHRGRDLFKQGAHVKGYNAGNIGICYTGKSGPTLKQLMSMTDLCTTICTLFDLDPCLTLVPHNIFNQLKTCPNFEINDLVHAVANRVKRSPLQW